ncbi:hypothetical protein R8Z50_12490 [Longispora sp. K20-0274]|uniref:hypothetical protein n=1 Tax=Longispora sp. K20-0274 TaxID=3088255 RepID=UPI003999AC61
MSVFRGSLIVVAALAVGVSTGCSPSTTTASDARPTSTPAGSAPSAAAPSATVQAVGASCELAPAAVVASALGVQVGAPVQAPTPEGGVVCTYLKSGSGAATGATTVVVRMRVGVTAAEFAATKSKSDKAMPSTGVAGLGDEAYSSTLGAVNNLTARKGSAQIFVSTALAGLDQERALMEQLFPKM